MSVKIFVKLFWNRKLRVKILTDMDLYKFPIFTAIPFPFEDSSHKFSLKLAEHHGKEYPEYWQALRNYIPIFQIQLFVAASTLDAAFFSFPVISFMYMVIVLKLRTPIVLALSSMLLEKTWILSIVHIIKITLNIMYFKTRFSSEETGPEIFARSPQ